MHRSTLAAMVLAALALPAAAETRDPLVLYPEK